MTYSHPRQPMLITKFAATSRGRFFVRSLIMLGFWAGATIPASAQITSDGTGTTPTIVTNNYTITGGTQNGSNLFHSFGEFGVPDGQVADFKQPATEITNILGRVTGGQASVINGKIQVTPVTGNTSPVNLFLMNPAGIIFGNGASLNVPGAFTATTANAIGFGNDQWFNAFGNYDALNGAPTDFAFTTKTPGSIFNAADFNTTTTNIATPRDKVTSITLIGGTVISTGTITVEGGKITIATVPGDKFVRIETEGNVLAMEFPTIDTKNRINNNTSPPTPLSLPELLTSSNAVNAANKVTVENGEVKLLGDTLMVDAEGKVQNGPDTRSIASGDIVTKELNTSNSSQNGNGGTVVLKAQTSIYTGRIDSRSTDNANNPDTKGGEVNLETVAGDIIVERIDTSSRNFSNGGTGGKLTIKSAGLFRALGKGTDQCGKCSIFTGGNKNGDIDNESTLGKISITYVGESDLLIGVEVKAIDGQQNAFEFTDKTDFKFKVGESGAVGAIASFNTNGFAGVARTDSGYVGVRADTGGFTTTINKPTAKDTQTARAKEKSESCNPTNNSGSSESTTSTAASLTATAADPCQPNSNSGKILQVLP